MFGFRKKEKSREELLADVDGTLIPIEDVMDHVFSLKMMGDGFAIDLTEGEVVAPFDAEVTAAFPTGHAYGLRRKDGVECLIHIGMDTVELNGEGFDVKVEQGAKVKQGQTLVVVDLEAVKAKGKSLVTPVIFPSGAAFTMNKKDGIVAKAEENILKFS